MSISERDLCKRSEPFSPIIPGPFLSPEPNLVALKSLEIIPANTYRTPSEVLHKKRQSQPRNLELKASQSLAKLFGLAINIW